MNDINRKHEWLKASARQAALARQGYSNLDSFFVINQALRSNGIEISGMSDQEKINIYEGKS